MGCPSGPHHHSTRRSRWRDEVGEDGKRAYTVAQIAAEFGVTRPTIYRHLDKSRGPQLS